MTTAAGFREAASVLTEVEGRLTAVLRHVGDVPVGFEGPRRVLIASAIDVAHANVRIALVQIEEQIDEAYARAAVCAGYTEAVRRYFRSNDPNRGWPRPPAPWVTYG